MIPEYSITTGSNTWAAWWPQAAPGGDDGGLAGQPAWRPTTPRTGPNGATLAVPPAAVLCPA